MNADKKTKKTKKLRLDELITQKGLCENRSKAKALIMAGKVFVDEVKSTKPGHQFPENANLRVKSPPRFVSRGGEKLEGFLKEHPIEIENKEILDVGASTGGFTDCLLQSGASKAICIDVGRAQLHEKIKNNPKVTNIEKINARHLRPTDLPLPYYDIIVMDLSFISLTKVLIPCWQLLKDEGHLISLIKPQFEAKKEETDLNKGIIKDPKIHQRILEEIKKFINSELEGSEIFALKPSIIKGTEGNQEFLIGIKKNQNGTLTK